MESRAAVRQDLTELRFASLLTRAPDGTLLEGMILDGNAQGLSMLIEVPHPPLEIGTSVDMILRVKGSALHLGAIVRNHSLLEGVNRYGVEFTLEAELDDQLGSSTLRRIFDRRASARVRLGPEEEGRVMLRIEDRREELHGRLHDLSVDGLCVETSPEELRAMEGVERLLVEFRLPGHSAPLGLIVAVCARTERAGRGFLSLHIPKDARSRLRFTLERIAAFVAERLGDGQRQPNHHSPGTSGARAFGQRRSG